MKLIENTVKTGRRHVPLPLQLALSILCIMSCTICLNKCNDNFVVIIFLFTVSGGFFYASKVNWNGRDSLQYEQGMFSPSMLSSSHRFFFFWMLPFDFVMPFSFQAYLSLPEGTASVVGLIALMTDYYNVMVRVYYVFIYLFIIIIRNINWNGISELWFVCVSFKCLVLFFWFIVCVWFR